jgi:hypothetical protein
MSVIEKCWFGRGKEQKADKKGEGLWVDVTVIST